MGKRRCWQHHRWILYICGLGVLVLGYSFLTVAIPNKYSLFRSFPPIQDVHVLETSLSLPKWERRHQFLDNVAAFKITNDDPLAMKYGVSSLESNSITTSLKPVVHYDHHKSSIRVNDGGAFLSHRKFRQHRKRIVVFNHPDWNWLRMGNIALNDCPVDCSLTADTSELQTADAVIFYAVAMYDRRPQRPKDQIWIFFTLESPVYSRTNSFNSPEWHNQINWTMTYRSDSDIWYPYGRVNRRRDPLSTNYTALAEKKTEKVAWFVSHCWTQSRREAYADILQKHIKIDIFGVCGTKSCGPEGSNECFKMLTNKYKFYLSFENAVCDDYVTEKLFRKVMMADIVPIVYGHVDYTRYMPPKSFINVADFDSVASLANYLIYLDKNITAYSEYLEWKRYYFVVEKPNPTCEVCMKLTEQEKYRRVYKDIFSWWSNGTCHPSMTLV